MKHKVLLTTIIGSLLALTSLQVSAASIQFEDDTNQAGNFTVSIAGVNPAANSTSIGKSISFTLPTTGATPDQVRYDTVALNSTLNPETNILHHASGSITWQSEGHSNIYTVTMSAGGIYNGGNNSQCYTMVMSVDGRSIGQHTTSLTTTPWPSHTVSNVTIKPDSVINVKLTNSGQCRS